MDLEKHFIQAPARKNVEESCFCEDVQVISPCRLNWRALTDPLSKLKDMPATCFRDSNYMLSVDVQ